MSMIRTLMFSFIAFSLSTAVLVAAPGKATPAPKIEMSLTILVGSFATELEAQHFIAHVNLPGTPTFIDIDSSSGKKLFRVCAGLAQNQEAAETLLMEVRQKLRIAGNIVSVRRSSSAVATPPATAVKFCGGVTASDSWWAVDADMQHACELSLKMQPAHATYDGKQFAVLQQAGAADSVDTVKCESPGWFAIAISADATAAKTPKVAGMVCQAISRPGAERQALKKCSDKAHGPGCRIQFSALADGSSPCGNAAAIAAPASETSATSYGSQGMLYDAQSHSLRALDYGCKH